MENQNKLQIKKQITVEPVDKDKMNIDKEDNKSLEN